MDTSNFDITPDKSLIRKLGYTGYRTVDAISELIDNAIDARLESMTTIRIIASPEKSEIIISDNGVGMDKSTLNSALTLAKSLDTKKNRIGMFGLGLKTACSTLGKKFTIKTATKNSNLYSVEYDEELWESDDNRNWLNFPYLSKQKLDNSYHGTEIIIEKLKFVLEHYKISTYRKYFGKRYSKYILNKQIQIIVNGTICYPTEPNIEKNSTQEFTLSVSGKTIPVKIWLLKTRSIMGNYGMDLYSKNRLIKAHSDFGMTKHPAIAKIAGTISLDHVPVNFHKTDFITESSEYKQVHEAFINHEIVKNIIKSQRSFNIEKHTTDELHEYFSGTRKTPPKIDARMGGKNTTKKLLEILKPITINGGKRRVSIIFGNGKSMYTVNEFESNLEIIVGVDSPVFRTTKNPFYIVALVVSEARSIAESNNYPKEFFNARNKMWEKFATEMIPEKISEKNIVNNEYMEEYAVSASLEKLYEYLKTKCEKRYVFTAFSTLEKYTHNSIRIPIYSIYTEKNNGEYLKDVIEKSYPEFLVIHNPTISHLTSILDFDFKQSVILIREYSRNELEKNIAKPSTAWMDMYREITQYGFPLSNTDLLVMFEKLFDNKMITKKQLLTIADRRKIRSNISEFVKELLYIEPTV